MSSELRQRHKPSSSKPSPKTSTSTPSNNARGISILDILRVLATLIIATLGLSYYMTGSESVLFGYRPWFTRLPVVLRYIQGPLLLTPTELSLYNGTDPTLPIYLSVNGTIFDVSANPLVYGAGGHYNFFTGRDATRAFVTGCFKEDLTPDMRGVEEMFIPIDDPEEEKMLSSGERKKRREQDLRIARQRIQTQVAHWEGFFRGHKKYFEVGKVVGLEEVIAKEEKRELCTAAKQQRGRREGGGSVKGKE
ncbi:putative heme/steroid binding domain protein [Aspergillus ibericus CBS 121593]|uniref:Heme/steroid binding domain protein n=1 Tax=Aspergillus ibericus CBS 121593 TaxID=1448316 RepID=A0A395HGW0_9EURO|nr:heme/steroid binding domain protein [Aspergillus ibericus CBS 121593]RAL05464.1 heme/steroid binding domain protein [Aspergillus ibericus CBS 121593]